MTLHRSGRWVPCLMKDQNTGRLYACCGHQKEAAGKHVDGNFDDFIVVNSLDAAREICRLMNSKGSGVDS